MKALTLIIIAVLVAALAWTGAAVVRLENYRYANFLGSCSQYNIADPTQRIAREVCLDKQETRTSWAWHLLYGLRIL